MAQSLIKKQTPQGNILFKFSRDTCEHPKHIHTTYMVGLFFKGNSAFTIDGKKYEADEKRFFLIHPGSVHANHCPPDQREWNLATLNIDNAFMQQIAHSLEKNSLPEFSTFSYTDKAILNSLQTIFRQTINHTSSLESETLLFETLAKLIRQYGYAPKDRQPLKYGKDDHRIIQQVREYLNTLDDLSQADLQNLAQITAYSPFHFSRIFKNTTGLTPGQYVTLFKIERAKEKIIEGMPLTQVAVESGFYDQAHMNRQFKKYQGITPGTFGRKVFSLQEI